LKQFSDDSNVAKELYESFAMERNAQDRREDLYKISDQRILGKETFLKEVFQRQGIREADLSKRPSIHFELDELKEIMEKVIGPEPDSLRSRGQFGTWMRRIFCYIARTYGAHKGKNIAQYLGKDLATVTHSVRFVENLRDAGDQKTIDVIERIVDIADKRTISWEERERILASFFAERKEQITIAYLFGSLVRGKAGPLSDVDIAVCFRDEKAMGGRYELAFQLRQLLGVGDVDLIVLNRSPIELKYRVVKTGRLVFCDSLITKVEFEARTLSQYGDYLPILRRQRREILEGTYGAGSVQRYRTAFGETERMLKQIGAI
jgi:predicted nucleotidyltransferase